MAIDIILRVIIFGFALIFSVNSHAFCYLFINKTNTNVAFKFYALDGNFQRTGQINTYPVDPGGTYPYSGQCLQYGLNTYNEVEVIGAKQSWDKGLIFGLNANARDYFALK